jgi:DNA-directed RNA polymerase beta subunit
MEKDVLSIAGLKLLQEKFVDHSDLCYIYVCKTCNRRAIVNEKNNIYNCMNCKDMGDIVKIKSTWSCNVFMNELDSANIGLKLYPKSNVFQKYEE